MTLTVKRLKCAHFNVKKKTLEKKLPSRELQLNLDAAIFQKLNRKSENEVIQILCKKGDYQDFDNWLSSSVKM